MKRTKEWWAKLIKEERSKLCHLEKGNSAWATHRSGKSDRNSKYCSRCPNCGAMHVELGLCPTCNKRLNELISKANQAVLAERSKEIHGSEDQL